MPMSPNSSPKTWQATLKSQLVADFITKRGHIFKGYFAVRDNNAETTRWQKTKGGEIAGNPLLPKRPYYQTYWGYQAAFKIAPEYVEKWRPLTLDGIRRHFGNDRWL